MNYVLNDLSIGILSLYYKKPYTVPTFEKRILSKEESASFEGIYNSSVVSMKITIKVNGDKITAQATGQPSFPLDKVSDLSKHEWLLGVSRRVHVVFFCSPFVEGTHVRRPYTLLLSSFY